MFIWIHVCCIKKRKTRKHHSTTLFFIMGSELLPVDGPSSPGWGCPVRPFRKVWLSSCDNLLFCPACTLITPQLPELILKFVLLFSISQIYQLHHWCNLWCKHQPLVRIILRQQNLLPPASFWSNEQFFLNFLFLWIKLSHFLTFHIL